MTLEFRQMTVNHMKDGSGVVVRRSDKPQEKGEIARSESPHEAVTLDFDAEGNLIEVEIVAVPYTAEEKAALAEAASKE